MQIVAKADSNMDKLSHLFMVAGQSAPRYEAMSRLYSRKSRRLLSYYQEYFLTIIDMCRRFVQIINKSSVTRLFSTISDSDLSTFQASIAHWASMIKEEAMLLMAQGVEDQGLSLSTILDISKSNAHRQRIEDNARVLATCSTYDHQACWKRVRKMGNTALFLQVQEYLSWRGDAAAMEKSGTLIYTGKLGAGKSVLMANMVEDLNLHATTVKVPVAYFFCQHDEPYSLQARTIIGSLARQFLLTMPDLSRGLAFIHDQIREVDLDGIIHLLKEVLPVDFKAYCVIDGLDECDSTERRLLVLKLRELQDTFALRICASFRLEADNGLRLDTKGFINCATVVIPEDNPEIEQFICDELERCIDSELLTLGDPTLVADIMNTLVELSQGMFLWVVLQITSLCGCKTDDDIRQALADMPRDLAETFTRVLNKCEPSAKKYQKQILELVLVARRPLTTEELREALGVTPGDTNWNPSRLPNNIYSVLASCGGLLTIDEETSTVRMVHQSARDFLLGAFQGRTEPPLLTTHAAHATMSWIIITYLNYGIFDTQLSKPTTSTAIPMITPSAAIQSTSSNTVKSLSLMLLRAKKSTSPKIDISRILEDIRGQAKTANPQTHHFYSYATSHWTHHLINTKDTDQTLSNLIARLLPKHSITNYNYRTKFNLLAWAATNPALYKQIHSHASEAIWFQHDLLSWAVRHNHILLLQTHDSTFPLQPGTTSSIIPIAALNGHYRPLVFLINRLPNLPTTTLGTAIMMAMTGDHAPIVRYLLTGTYNPPDSDNSANDEESNTEMNGHLARQGTQMLHNRVYSRKLLLWAHVFKRDHLARLLIDLGAKTTDALQPKLDEELRSQTNDYSESSLLDEMKLEMFGDLTVGHGDGGLDPEQEGMLISAAKILFETKNVSLLNSFLIARQKGSSDGNQAAAYHLSEQ